MAHATLLSVIGENEIILAPGAYDAISARIIAQSGCPLVYLSGLANEASDLGLPDLGFTSAPELVRRAGIISRLVDVPVVSDADTGFGGPANVVQTVRAFEAAGIAAIHLEDQAFPKRCGVLSGKSVVPRHVFARTIERACASRTSTGFTIIARTDAKSEGLDSVTDRLRAYADAGADAVMLGDFYSASEYAQIAASLSVPLIACAADPHHYDVQPDYSRAQWIETGVKIVIYWHLPLFAAQRAVRTAAEHLARHGSLTSPPLETDGYRDYASTVDLERWLRLASEPDD